MIYKQLGSTKTKRASHILQYITHLHQHTKSIHNSYVSKMCIQNIVNLYFCGFLNSRLLTFAWNWQKLMQHKYYHKFLSIPFIIYLWQKKHENISPEHSTQDSHMKRYIFLSTEFAERRLRGDVLYDITKFCKRFSVWSPYIKRN